MRVNLLLSIIKPRLEDDIASGFRSGAEWEVVAESGDRLLVDAVGSAAFAEAALVALDYLGRAPLVLGGWQMDGAVVEGYPHSPGVWPEYDPATGHRFQGWAPRQLPE